MIDIIHLKNWYLIFKTKIHIGLSFKFIWMKTFYICIKQQMSYFGLPSNLLFTFGSSTSFSLFFTEGQNDIDTSYVLAQFNGKKQLTCIIFYLRLLGWHCLFLSIILTFIWVKSTTCSLQWINIWIVFFLFQLCTFRGWTNRHLRKTRCLRRRKYI